MKPKSKSEVIKLIDKHGPENLIVLRYLERNGRTYLYRLGNPNELLCRVSKHIFNWFDLEQVERPYLNMANYIFVNPDTPKP